MAKETAKKFLMEYAANPEAMKLLNEYPQPETLGDGAKILSEIAGKLGPALLRTGAMGAGAGLLLAVVFVLLCQLFSHGR